VRYNKLLEEWEYFTNQGSHWFGTGGNVRDTEAAPQQAQSPLPDDYVRFAHRSRRLTVRLSSKQK
jgi:hypothetical protein